MEEKKSNSDHKVVKRVGYGFLAVLSTAAIVLS